MPDLTPNPFVYVAPDEHSRDVIGSVTVGFQDTYERIVSNIPDCRERALAITKLQEARMWVNAAIVFTQARTRD